ncbi:ABC transporter permease [uncultured Cellulomonas sp.]|uniref:ABC transporter permease n=1 Tax=uncultured Cellulomonas sp. TaxID=189682 RepID=UPI0028ECD6D3|nr:ABC transporter permease [uncultured Cellulomonas sp.]
MIALQLVGAGFRLQLAITRRTPAQFLVLVAAPLFSAIFLSLAIQGGDPAMVVNAVVGPGLIGLWSISLDVAGSMLSEDRYTGRLELIIGSPGSLNLSVLGRIMAVTVVGGLAFLESWLVARVGFGVEVPVLNPGIVGLALVATILATAGTATMLAALFMLSRTVDVYKNAMSYPIYILGGVVVPAALLPGFLGPLSKVVYLSWSADLLRESMSDAQVTEVAARLGAIVGLGAVALVISTILTRTVRERLRRSATAAFA